ncbi:MAG: SOS response-associated peptidase [Candidatus Sericytochromatia bacterium]|uniref:Abasic site processing protein n=1 Tax=Candidatus Tanganyikabacteria bacterium TaxID=2961651 RepID=A0A938BKE9_9BACT|nr:SOS response-associated peptidase [Candidatus Tanganyikabacteria bacterium]
MCGRFSLTAAGPILAELFAVDEVDAAVLAGWRARYNVAPSQPVATVRSADGTRRRLDLLRWGLLPRWAKDPKAGPAPINARGDTVAEKPMFKGLLKSRRCIVPADGFFEWKKADGKKLPMYLQMADREPFGIAGLWESWRGGDQIIESVTLLTTGPNEMVSEIHDRMPAILPPECYAAWIDPAISDPAVLLPLIGPYPAPLMRVTPVSTRVNAATFDDPSCVDPPGQQEALPI